MFTVVKIISIGDEENVNKSDRNWHLMAHSCGDRVTLCQNLMLDGANIQFTTKEVERGGITCNSCIKIIRQFHEIKL